LLDVLRVLPPDVVGDIVSLAACGAVRNINCKWALGRVVALRSTCKAFREATDEAITSFSLDGTQLTAAAADPGFAGRTLRRFPRCAAATLACAPSPHPTPPCTHPPPAHPLRHVPRPAPARSPSDTAIRTPITPTRRLQRLVFSRSYVHDRRPTTPKHVVSLLWAAESAGALGKVRPRDPAMLPSRLTDTGSHKLIRGPFTADLSTQPVQVPPHPGTSRHRLFRCPLAPCPLLTDRLTQTDISSQPGPLVQTDTVPSKPGPFQKTDPSLATN
jgi:hypothetical protein